MSSVPAGDLDAEFVNQKYILFSMELPGCKSACSLPCIKHLCASATFDVVSLFIAHVHLRVTCVDLPMFFDQKFNINYIIHVWSFWSAAIEPTYRCSTVFAGNISYLVASFAWEQQNHAFFWYMWHSENACQYTSCGGSNSSSGSSSRSGCEIRSHRECSCTVGSTGSYRIVPVIASNSSCMRTSG